MKGIKETVLVLICLGQAVSEMKLLLLDFAVDILKLNGSASAHGPPRLRPNSIGSLRQYASVTEINSVTEPRIPYGGSINRPVALTLRIPSRDVLKTTGRHSFSLKQFVVPTMDTVNKSPLL
ncbi:hypothetical protein TNCV_4164371 [Trichonephila clavipes]|nr:hypothetical protein TNCV_4164371 [Trichonephila clavipes]